MSRRERANSASARAVGPRRGSSASARASARERKTYPVWKSSGRTTRSAAFPPSALSTSRSASVTLRSTSPKCGRVCATTTRHLSLAERIPLAERIGPRRERVVEGGKVEHFAHRLLQVGQAPLEEMAGALEEAHPFGL